MIWVVSLQDEMGVTDMVRKSHRGWGRFRSETQQNGTQLKDGSPRDIVFLVPFGVHHLPESGHVNHPTNMQLKVVSWTDLLSHKSFD